jgi:hypothetical protein
MKVTPFLGRARLLAHEDEAGHGNPPPLSNSVQIPAGVDPALGEFLHVAKIPT